MSTGENEKIEFYELDDEFNDPKPESYPFEDISQIPTKDNVANKPLLSDSDLNEIISPENFKISNRKTYDKINKNYSPTERQSSIIKKNSKKQREVITSEELSHFFESEPAEYKKEDFVITNEDDGPGRTEYINRNFRDFLQYPKISGEDKFGLERKFIPKEQIQGKDKKIEIADSVKFDEENHSTTIEIIRSAEGDIENIVVYCRCGEKTLIRFDYDDKTDADETQIIKDPPGSIAPLNVSNLNIRKLFDDRE